MQPVGLNEVRDLQLSSKKFTMDINSGIKFTSGSSELHSFFVVYNGYSLCWLPRSGSYRGAKTPLSLPMGRAPSIYSFLREK